MKRHVLNHPQAVYTGILAPAVGKSFFLWQILLFWFLSWALLTIHCTPRPATCTREWESRYFRSSPRAKKMCHFIASWSPPPLPPSTLHGYGAAFLALQSPPLPRFQPPETVWFTSRTVKDYNKPSADVMPHCCGEDFGGISMPRSWGSGDPGLEMGVVSKGPLYIILLVASVSAVG